MIKRTKINIEDPALAINLFKKMRLIRFVEEAIAEKYPEGKMRCPTHLSIGQEAVSAAAGLALEIEDPVVSTHRSHGHYLGKGGSVQSMIAELYGKETGCSKGFGGSMHLIDKSVGFVGSTAIVGSSIPVGVGIGLALQLESNSQVCGIFLGDGAVEEGVFWEAANFAALKSLPILFICENNLYSVYSNIDSRQPKGRKIYELVSGMGLQTSHGDGNNAIESYQIIKEARDACQGGCGPQFVELSTYRWREHCGPHFDNHLGYRDMQEFEEWKEYDPIAGLEQSLKSEGLVTANAIEDMDFEIKKIIDDAFENAEQSEFPNPKSIANCIYKDEISEC